MSLDARTFKIIAFFAHVVLIFLMFFIYAKFDVSGAVPLVLELAPVATIYEKFDLNWLGHWREISHLILTVFDGMVGFLLIQFGLKRRYDLPKFLAVAIGSQLIFSSLLSVTLIGLVAWGGVWHFLSAVVAMLMGGSALISFSLLWIFWQSLLSIGEKQDKFTSLKEEEPPAAQ